MKSIILIVLLAVCHTSLGKPKDWEVRNYQPCQASGAEPVFTVRADGDADQESDADNSGSPYPPFPDSDDDNSDDRYPPFPDSDDDDNSGNRYPPFPDSDDKEIESIRGSGHGSIIDNNDKVDCDCNKNKPKITYGPEQIVKGKPETYIHHQPKIIVRQPPTHVRIEHPPTIIQPSTIVFRRHGKTIRRPVIYQHLPQDVRVRPVYVKVVKPIEKKVIIENKSKQAQILHSKGNDDNLEYEMSHGGQVYSGSFDEHQQESEDIQKSKKIRVNEYEGPYRGRSYSGSYDEQQQASKDSQKSKQVHVSEYDVPFGGRRYSESVDEREHEEEAYHAHVNVKETESY